MLSEQAVLALELQSHMRALLGGNPNTISAILVCILASVIFDLERPN